MKHIVEAKVIEVSELKDQKNPEVKYLVVLESQKKITATLTAPDFVKAKSLIKPSKVGEVLRFECEIFNLKDGLGVKSYYRLTKEVK